MKQRVGVHTEVNIERDKSGENSLLSDHFYYFGNRAIDIPERLSPIINQGQGHKSNLEPYKHEFVEWIEGLGLQPNELYGHPQVKLDLRADLESRKKSCSIRKKDEDKEVC